MLVYQRVSGINGKVEALYQNIDQRQKGINLSFLLFPPSTVSPLSPLSLSPSISICQDWEAAARK